MIIIYNNKIMIYLDDTDMIFNLDVDHTEVSSDNASSSNLNLTTLHSMPSLKSRTRSPLRSKIHTTRRHKHVNILILEELF